ncbi:MAG: ASCH domain-containing protein [Patescibacteria group bacterium]
MKQLSFYKTKRTHVAIMRQSLGVLEKIIFGEKTIETRWYKNRSQPWDAIEPGDVVYFKNAGEPVTAQATIGVVRQFEDLTPAKIRAILEEYADRIGIDPGNIDDFCQRHRDKKYCLLIFLQNPLAVKPFEINKTGFGNQTAWLVIDNIDKIKKTTVTQPKLLGRKQ